MPVSNGDKRWLSSALRVAKKHDPHGRYSLAAFVVKGGRVLSMGTNCYLKPGAVKDPSYDYRGIHAELAALVDLLKKDDKVKGATLYVAGTTKTGEVLKTTKPCPVCQALIERAGDAIDRVVFFEEGEPNEMVIKI